MSAPLRWWAGWVPRSSYWQDISWVASGTALAQLIGLLSMPLLTRLYSPADFAALSIFTQAAAFAMGLMTLRFEYAIQLPRHEIGALALLRLVLLLATLGALLGTPLMWWAGPRLAGWLGQPAMDIGLRLVPLTAAVMAAALALQHLAQRRREFRRSGVAEAINKLAYALWALVGHWILPGAIGLLSAIGLGTVAKVLVLLPAGPGRPGARSHKPHRRTWWRLIGRALRDHAALARSMVSSHLMLTFTGLIPALYLTRQHGADVLGQYALVVSTNYLPSALVGTAIGQVYYQRAAEHWSKGEAIGALWRSTTRRLTMLGLPMFIALALLSPWLYPWLFGAQWQQAGLFSAILCLASLLSFVTVPLDRTSLVVGAWRYLPWWHFGRLLSTAGVVGWAALADLSAVQFMVALSLQMSAMYTIDLVAQRRFAARRPIGPAASAGDAGA